MAKEQSPCLQIPIKQAETIRKQLLSNNILRTDLKIEKDKKFIYLPIQIDHESINQFKDRFQIITTTFEKQTEKIHDYKELLNIPTSLQNELPRSFDIIESIIIIRLDEKLKPYEKEIGNALLKTHQHTQSVYSIDPVEGELRTRSVHHITGKKQTETIHREYNTNFYVDIEKTYFSPRLATERKYIASLVKPDETILDMFTGVAPFPIIISKYSKPKNIIAIDKNEKAIELAKKNIEQNHITIPIQLYCEDAIKSSTIIKKQHNHVDRIIMNLPFQSIDFFTYALDCIQKQSKIHIYMIGDEKTINNNIESMIQIGKKQEFSIIIENKRKIKSDSPHEFYMGIDITAKKDQNADVA